MDKVKTLASRLDADSLLRLSVEAAPNAMIIVDDRGLIVLANASAERDFGYSRSELLGQPIEMLLPARLSGRHQNLRAGYVSHPEARSMGEGRDLLARRKDGAEFPVEVGLNPAPTEAGVMVLAAIVDITRRKADEQALRDWEKRLQELQSELQHVSRLSAMGELASALAHEVNQPLAAIGNYMKGSRRLLAASEHPAAPRIEEALDKAAEQAVRAGQIIRRLREFVARGESDRRPEKLDELVEDALALGLIGQRELNIAARLDIESETVVLVDRIQIQQVLVNLVRNAADAMAESLPRELSIRARGNGEGVVEIAVSDTGTGLPEDAAEKLFRPFFSTKESGMGVGLSISRSIVEAHGGQLRAESNVGRGATFRFTVPSAILHA